jgi:hypothetical protein
MLIFPSLGPPQKPFVDRVHVVSSDCDGKANTVIAPSAYSVMLAGNVPVA